MLQVLSSPSRYHRFPSVILGRDTLDFEGLSTTGYRTDSDTASFVWVPGAGAHGIHSIHIGAASVSGEPDTRDNSVTIPFLIQPRDYADVVLDDAWDMSEGGSNDWNTDDVVDISARWLSSAWTDSVSGMFEGALDTTISGSLMKGNIQLAIPEDTYFDSDDYFMLSFAGVSNNPMVSSSTDGCAIHIGFSDTTSTDITWANLSAATGGLGTGGINGRSLDRYILTVCSQVLHHGPGTSLTSVVEFQDGKSRQRQT